MCSDRLFVMLIGVLCVCIGACSDDAKKQADNESKQAETPTARYPHDGETSFTPYRPPSGSRYVNLGIDVIKPGTGAVVQKGNRISIHATGTLRDGTVFWTTRTPGRERPVDLVIDDGQVIDGWIQGMVGQRVGSRIQLKIPARLAYGANGRDKIPPNSDLDFDVEILEIR